MCLLAWEFLLIKSALHFAFLHLLSGYYYVVMCWESGVRLIHFFLHKCEYFISIRHQRYTFIIQSCSTPFADTQAWSCSCAWPGHPGLVTATAPCVQCPKEKNMPSWQEWIKRRVKSHLWRASFADRSSSQSWISLTLSHIWACRSFCSSVSGLAPHFWLITVDCNWELPIFLVQ